MTIIDTHRWERVAEASRQQTTATFERNYQYSCQRCGKVRWVTQSYLTANVRLEQPTFDLCKGQQHD